jgi:hypothetical protein
MGVSELGTIALGPAGTRALDCTGADPRRLQRAFGAAALLGVAPFAHAFDRPLLAFGCVGAALPLLAAAAFADRRIRVAVEALVLAGTLAAFVATKAVAAAWPSRTAPAAAVALLVAGLLAVEAARRAVPARRFATIPFWLLAALLAAAGYLHIVARGWLALIAGSAAGGGPDVLGVLSLTAAHAGYALSGIAPVFALFVRSLIAGAPAGAALVATADRWRLITAGGAALAAVLYTAS